ncbi:MAG: serine/threonine protein kinase [Planctomycetes bacterium]|nr:serine/threonine protein kinase [Planctomycetota bacterium]
MASSVQDKADLRLRRVSEEEAAVVPDNARPTDDTPTVISKTPPIPEPISSNQNKVTDLGRSAAMSDSLIAGLRGKRLAHYELIEPIGVGGMAAVIRARDTQLDRFVALKILPPDMAHETENIQRFHQEAKAAAKLDHANIARVFYCGEDQGLHFIAFEYVEGVNLRTLLEQRGRLSALEAIRYVVQIATGLEHAASRGVVHRDVKPSNIIIMPSGQAKLVDMGLARNMERHNERDLTQSGVTLGTFDYISPEQALEPREADARSDIYSLGCTLYHMLTGMAPVPEGTPAKKLHHHQHVAPIDPREIDPAIPAELVMILGKMMMKEPRDRYQRPLHLVHYLMKVARQLGAENDLPGGVVDAPFPVDARPRPFLLIGLALAALIAVVAFVSLGTDSAPHFSSPPNLSKNDKLKADAKPDARANDAKVVQNPSKTRPDVIKNLDQLRHVLNDAAPGEVKTAIDGVFDLTGAGLTISGAANQRRVFESTSPGVFTAVNFKYDYVGASAALEVRGGKVTFRRIRFLLTSDAVADNAAAAAAVIVRGAREVTFDRCVFVQTVPPISLDRTPFASVLIDSADSPANAAPVVNLNDCYFDGGDAGGQVAIAINGPATVHARNCAFKPHGALFQFRGACTRTGTIVHLDHCAGLVERGPAFRFNDHAAAQLQVQHSVFSRPESSTASERALGQLDLLSFAENTGAVQYIGDANLYHNLNNMVGRSRNPIAPKESDFQTFLAQEKGKDQESVYLTRPDAGASPWQNSRGPGTQDHLVFQLKAEFHEKYGLKRTWLGPMDAPPVPLVKKIEGPRTLIVDADNDMKTAGVYANVQQALSGAKDGDEILIKCGPTRIVKVPPGPLRQGISVTLRPYEGCQPILVFDRGFNDKDSALFTVMAGTLHIKDMEILLDPEKIPYEAQSIVHLGQAARCRFTGCTLTLRGPSDDVKLYVATFINRELMMKSDTPAPGTAKVEFRDCFVRGRGTLVALRGCRLLDVNVKNSLVVLDGALLDITAANKAMPMNLGVRWKMDHSTIYTADSIFCLKSMTEKGLTETIAEIDSCLFGSLAADKPIVLLRTETGDDLNTFLKWKGNQNYFANFDEFKIRTWKDQDRETNSSFGKLTLPNLSDENRQILWDATPEWFRPTAEEMKALTPNVGIPPEIEKNFIPAPPKSDDP